MRVMWVLGVLELKHVENNVLTDSAQQGRHNKGPER